MAFNQSFEFKVGMTFDSWVEFEDKKKKYEASSGETFTTFRSEKLYCCDFEKCIKDEDQINELVTKLKYKFVTLKCKYGKATKKPKQNKERVTSTFNHGCRASMTLKRVLTHEANYKLIISEINFNHENHPLHYKELRYVLPEQRRLPPELKHQVGEYIKLGCSNKKIRHEISQKYNIYLLSKDISNIAQALKPPNGNDLKTLDALLKKEYGCTTRINVDDKKNFKALFFTNATMQTSMSNWPEMLFIDGTYKLFNLGFTLYLIMVQTGSGRGEIVGAAILKIETADNIKWVAKNFRELNEEACKKTTCIMTDKDLTERNAFAEIFPDARFLLCLFHTLKTFDRQLKLMKLNKEERVLSFRLLRNLAYSKSKKNYDNLYQELVSKTPKSVVNYFNTNWHSIRDEWTKFSMAVFNYGNDTNNIVESTNKQIKTICNYHSTLCEFATNFFKLLNTSKQETNLLTAIDGLKRLNIEHELGSFVNEYAEFLTKVAFSKLADELKKYNSIIITESCNATKMCSMIINGYRFTASTTDCTCHFRVSLKLPCVHILSVRKHFQLNLFCSQLCDPKWSKAVNLKNVGSTFRENLEDDLDISLITNPFIAISETKGVSESDKTHHELLNKDSSVAEYNTTKSENEKRRILLGLFDKIMETALQVSDPEFHQLCQNLETLNLTSQKKKQIDNTNDNVDLSNIALPPVVRLRGRPKAAMKTTTGYFPRKM